MVNKRLILIIFILCLCFKAVIADGTCTLDKTEYITGELATVSCTCTAGGEQNTAGFFVWHNQDTGTILQATATNSLACISAAFTDMYTILSPSYEGNVSFCSLADCSTGAPSGWDGVTDQPTAFYNVSAATGNECIIDFENVTQFVYDLGRDVGAEVTVRDVISNLTLTHARCALHIKQVTGQHFLHIPLQVGTGEYHIRTEAKGNTVFTHYMGESIWEANTQYLMDVSCYCTPSGTDEECYLSNGTSPGFRECEFTTFFNTGDDLRNETSNNISLILWQIFVIVSLSVIGWLGIRTGKNKTSNNKTPFAFYMGILIVFVAYLEFILTYFMLHAKETHYNISTLISMNAYVLLSTYIGIIFYVGYNFFIRNFEEIKVDTKK